MIYSRGIRLSIILLLALILTIAVLARVRARTNDSADTLALTEHLLLPLVLGEYGSESGGGSAGGGGGGNGQPIPEKSFGVQMYGDTRTETTYNSFATQSKAGTVRVPYTWPDSAPAQPQWSDIDRVFAIATETHGGVNIVATLERVPDWAATNRYGPLHEAYYPAMAQFMGQVVERYDGDGIDDAPGSPVITYWEMYNEPDRGNDNNPHLFWGDNGDVYAMMLQTIYPAMKAANPDAQIVMGGLAYDWFEDQGGPFVRTFIDDVLAAGGCAYFDVMNFHSFPFYANRWTDNQGAGVYEKTVAIQEKLAEYDCYRPIIITESGWHSDAPEWNPSSYEEQARYIPQLFAQSFAADVEILVWWMLYDPAGNYWDNGLVTDDTPPQIKPSFYAYQVLRDTLLGTSFSKRYAPEELPRDHMELYAFDDVIRQRTVYIAWLNPVESTDTTMLSFSANMVTVQTLYGDTTTVYDTDDGVADGVAKVPVTAQPVYIFVDQP